MKKVLLSAMAALSLVACQESFSDKNTAGEGKIAITASVTGEVTTRVETGVDIPTPALSEFSLLIQGTDANTSLTEPRSW